MSLDFEKLEAMRDDELIVYFFIENPEGIWNPIEAFGCPTQNCYSAWYR